MKKNIWLLIIILVVPATAQTWELVNPLPAGRADDIAIGYTNGGAQRLYIADQLSWPFRSTDGGVTWDSLFHELSYRPNAIITIPDDAEKIWIARKEDGVLYSRNAGATWVWRIEGLTNLYVLTLEMAPDNPSVIFAGCYSNPSNPQPNVFKTTNGGLTWAPTQGYPPVIDVYDIETPGAPYDILLAGCNGGIYRSSDGGTNWQLKYSGIAYDICRDPSNDGCFYAAVQNDGQGKVLKSTDFGNSWQEVLTLPPGEYPRKIAISSAPNWRIYVATQGAGVYWKGPDPDQWHLDGAERGIYDKLATTIAVDPNNADFIVYGTATAVYRNTNFPTDSWEFLSSGFRIIHPAAFTTSLPTGIYAKAVRQGVNPQNGVSSNGISIYRSTDNGQNWKIIHSTYSYEDYIRGPKTLMSHPLNGNQIYLAFEYGMDFHRIHSSPDGGLTWFEWHYSSACMRQSIAVDQYTQIAYEVDDTQYPGNQRDPQVLVTINGGVTWEVGGTMTGVPLSVASFPSNSGVVYVGTGENGIYKSTNYGISWMPTGFISGSGIKSLAIDNPDIIYAGAETGDCGVYKSNNGGEEWFKMNNGLTYPAVVSLAIDPEEPTLIYAASYHLEQPLAHRIGHCYVSVDGGRKWCEITGELYPKEIYDIQIDYTQPDRLYALTTDGEYSPYPTPAGVYTYIFPYQFKSLTSSSPAATFANNGRKLLHIQGTDELWVCYESGGVIYAVHSTDNGTTWSRKIEVGEGTAPAISSTTLTITFPLPCLVWLAKGEQDTIYFAMYINENEWSDPVPVVVSQSNIDFGPPSFVIGDGNIGHLAYSDGTNSYYVNFEVYNPGNPSTPELIGSGINPCIGFMSSAQYPNLHTVLEDNGVIYYSARTENGWTREVVSEDEFIMTTDNHHPSLVIEGSVVYIVWDGVLDNRRDIFWRHLTYIDGDAEWSWIWPVCGTDNPSSYPVLTSGFFCSWVEEEGSDNEIYYARYDPMLWTWRDQTNISQSPQRNSCYSHLGHKQTQEGTMIYFIWTENSQAPFDIKFTTITLGGGGGGSPDLLSGLPLYIAKGGEEVSSPFNLFREGYVSYGNLPYQKVDKGTQSLRYRFEGLNPDYDYKIGVCVYQNGYAGLALGLKIDDVQIGSVSIPADTLIKRVHNLPVQFYQDGAVEMKILGNPALSGSVLIYKYERPRARGGPQDVGVVLMNLKKVMLNIYPNPGDRMFTVKYAISCETPVNLSLYDATGRLVRVLINEIQKSGSYQRMLDLSNLAQGVYFVRLNADNQTVVQKLIVLR